MSRHHEEDSGSALRRLATTLGSGTPGMAGRPGAPGTPAPAWDSGVLAIGWATVDLERAALELPHVDFDFAPGDEALGAKALIGHPGRIALLLLEPSTEGRLAATLARNGEGIAAIYQQSRGLPVAGTLLMTPLGRSGRLADVAQRWGPFLILIE